MKFLYPYSKKDKQVADAVCHYLEQEKLRC